MSTINKIENWGNSHHPIALDPVRIVLGVFLVMKGANIMNNTTAFESLISGQQAIPLPYGMLMGMVYLAAFAHLVGGAMITLGIATRIASLAQIPFVTGAVILAASTQLAVTSDLTLSVIALALLGLFSIVGSGRISIEKVMENQKTIFS